jgi:hypothetical protein
LIIEGSGAGSVTSNNRIRICNTDFSFPNELYHEQDARKRYSASDVLVHPWLRSGGASSALLLPTPALMRQNNNSKQLSQFADSAAAVNRVLLQHLSGTVPTYIYSLHALFCKAVYFSK